MSRIAYGSSAHHAFNAGVSWSERTAQMIRARDHLRDGARDLATLNVQFARAANRRLIQHLRAFSRVADIEARRSAL